MPRTGMGKGHGILKVYDSVRRPGYHSHSGYKLHPKNRDHPIKRR